MRERLVTWIGAFLIVGGLVSAITFTNVDTAKYHGKTGLKALTSVIDANNALIEVQSEAGTCTNGETVVFASVFASTPVITLTYQVDPGDSSAVDIAIFPSSVTTTSFVCNAVAAKLVGYKAEIN
jgi:hypothetical protein